MCGAFVRKCANIFARTEADDSTQKKTSMERTQNTFSRRECALAAFRTDENRFQFGLCMFVIPCPAPTFVGRPDGVRNLGRLIFRNSRTFALKTTKPSSCVSGTLRQLCPRTHTKRLGVWLCVLCGCVMCVCGLNVDGAVHAVRCFPHMRRCARECRHPLLCCPQITAKHFRGGGVKPKRKESDKAPAEKVLSSHRTTTGRW